MDTCCIIMREIRDRKVAALEAELVRFVEAGDEYHAEMVRWDIKAARSPARLIHEPCVIPL